MRTSGQSRQYQLRRAKVKCNGCQVRRPIVESYCSGRSSAVRWNYDSRKRNRLVRETTGLE